MTGLVFLRQALEELFEAKDFYEKDSPEAAEAFSSEIDRISLLISQNPSIGTPARHGLRRFTVQQFPYTIIYRIEADRVFVIAVAHHRREPEYWRNRLK